jgi:2-oxoglutarate ferredoxin oxidoreductase subunit beta
MPFGNVEGPVNPISLALAAGATFVARGFSAEQKHLTELIKQGIQHKGFSFLDVFSPCVTYNHDNTFQWFRPRVKKLEDDAAYDPADWMAAMGKSLLWDEEIPIGKFFERTDVPSLHGAEPVLNAGPLVQADTRIPLDVTRSFVQEVLLCKLHCSDGLLDCLETHGHVQGFLYSQNAPGGRLSYHRLEPTLMGVQP